MLSAASCASVSPPQQRVQRRVVSSEPILAMRHEGEAFVAASEWKGHEQFVGTVMRRASCEDDVNETVETTKYTTYTTKRLAADIGGGAAAIAVGGLSLVGAPNLSDAAPESGGNSPRVNAQIFGGTAIVAGAVFLAHGIFVSASASDEVSEPAITRERRKAAGPRRPCGTVPPGEGELVAVVGERRLRIADFPPTGEVTILPRSLGDKLCGNVEELSSTAQFLYAPGRREGGESGADLLLAQYKLEDCVRVTLAEKRLGEADAHLKGPSSRQLSAGSRALRSAAILVRGLKDDDPERDRLLKAIENRQSFANQRAKGAIEPETKRALAAIEADPQAAISVVADVSGLAMSMPDGKGAWTTIYGAFARRVQGLDGYNLVEQLLKIDEAALGCSSPSPICPTWVSPELLPTTIRPALASAASAVERLTREANEVSNDLKREISAKSLDRVNALRAKTEKVTALCSGVRATFIPLAEQCESLRRVLSGAESVLTARSEEVNEVRRKQAEAEARERLRKALVAWRTHFSACKRLSDGIRQLEKVRDEGKCGADCLNVIGRMQAERARQQEFRADQPFQDPAMRDRLRGECESAGCEVCP